MEKLEEARQFLDCAFFEGEKPWDPDPLKGRYPFITISRETGAGGHELANELIAQMRQERELLFHGWQVFDQEIWKKILEDPKLKVSVKALMTEEYRNQLEDILFNLVERQTPQDVVIHRIFQLLRTLASYGKVVLVGRAGACVTRSLPSGVHVRLVASEPSRVNRMVRLLHVDEKEARRVMEEQDCSRARLVKDYFKRDITDPLLYDVVWNTDTVPMETIAAVIIRMIQTKALAVSGSLSGKTRLS